MRGAILKSSWLHCSVPSIGYCFPANRTLFGRATSLPSELVADGLDASGLAGRLLDGLGARELHESAVTFHCGCNPDRVGAAVRLLGRDEIEQAANDGEALEVRCQFCGDRHRLGERELRALLAQA